MFVVVSLDCCKCVTLLLTAVISQAGAVDSVSPGAVIAVAVVFVSVSLVLLPTLNSLILSIYIVKRTISSGSYCRPLGKG